MEKGGGAETEGAHRHIKWDGVTGTGRDGEPRLEAKWTVNKSACAWAKCDWNVCDIPCWKAERQKGGTVESRKSGKRENRHRLPRRRQRETERLTAETQSVQEYDWERKMSHWVCKWQVDCGRCETRIEVARKWALVWRRVFNVPYWKRRR